MRKVFQMTKLWRITAKGSWPQFTQDVVAPNLDEAISTFVLDQAKYGSSCRSEDINKVELIGDTKR